jgi:hypothetical protein
MRKRFFTEINDDFFFRFKKEQVKEILRNIHKRRVHPGGYTSQVPLAFSGFEVQF